MNSENNVITLGGLKHFKETYVDAELTNYVKTEDLEDLIGSGGNIEIDTELSTESENAVQNKVITEALDTKLDKVTNTGGVLKAYLTLNGATQVRPLRASPTADDIPIYNNKAQLSTREPTSDLHCANKKYVDDAIANASSSSGGGGTQLYKHTISWGDLTATIITNQSTAVTGNDFTAIFNLIKGGVKTWLYYYDGGMSHCYMGINVENGYIYETPYEIEINPYISKAETWQLNELLGEYEIVDTVTNY